MGTPGGFFLNISRHSQMIKNVVPASLFFLFFSFFSVSWVSQGIISCWIDPLGIWNKLATWISHWLMSLLASFTVSNCMWKKNLVDWTMKTKWRIQTFKTRSLFHSRVENAWQIHEWRILIAKAAYDTQSRSRNKKERLKISEEGENDEMGLELCVLERVGFFMESAKLLRSLRVWIEDYFISSVLPQCARFGWRFLPLKLSELLGPFLSNQSPTLPVVQYHKNSCFILCPVL